MLKSLVNKLFVTKYFKEHKLSQFNFIVDDLKNEIITLFLKFPRTNGIQIINLVIFSPRKNSIRNRYFSETRTSAERLEFFYNEGTVNSQFLKRYGEGKLALQMVSSFTIDSCRRILPVSFYQSGY